MTEVYLEKFRHKVSELKAAKAAGSGWKYQASLQLTLELFLQEPPDELTEEELAEARSLVR